MIDRVLVVCVGNICRSPVAEGMLKQALHGKGIVVESAGISALVGQPADEKSIRLACSHGVDIRSHRAQQLTREMLAAADLILVMENRHTETITQMAPEVRGKIKLLGYWQENQEISDPYNRSIETFEKTIELIHQGVSRWLKYL